jgi:hypothetical protein
MSIDASQLDELVAKLPGTRILSEAGTTYVFIPNLKLLSGGSEYVVEALLCPTASSGYATRLFLSISIPGRGANWTQHHICGRTWHTWSWQGIPDSLSLAQILTAHLRALK